MTNKDWQKIVDRWESQQIQSRLAQLIDEIPQYHDSLPVLKAKMYSIILGFGSTIYTYATNSLDNLTRVAYGTLAMSLPLEYDQDPAKKKEEIKFFYEILAKMPKGFKDYSISGMLSAPDGHGLSLTKAKQFLDYLESDEFDNAMRQINRYYDQQNIQTV